MSDSVPHAQASRPRGSMPNANESCSPTTSSRFSRARIGRLRRVPARARRIVPARRNVDLAVALEKIGRRFGVRTLILEGGGRINGAMLRAGLIDEVSVLVAPVGDGRVGTPALFDLDGDGVVPQELALERTARPKVGPFTYTARWNTGPTSGRKE